MNIIEIESVCIDTITEFRHWAEIQYKKTHKKLYESNSNVQLYEAFILSWRQKAIDPSTLKIGQIYAPVTMFVSPMSETIEGMTTSVELELLTIGHVLVFENPNNRSQQLKLPDQTRNILGSSYQDTLIFADDKIRQKFLTILGLKFGNWNPNILNRF